MSRMSLVSLINATHNPALRSWVESANQPGCDFPIQNLPLGRFRRAGSDERWHAGVAIGDQVLDLTLATEWCPWADAIYPLLEPLDAGDLAAFMALGRPAWSALRAALSAALTDGSMQGPFLEACLVPQKQVVMGMPCRIGDYTDFYTGIHHARTVGALMRPDNPLLPNYPWVPIGYHGRASSVALGGLVKRPHGQLRNADGPPHFAPSRRLDYELELGLWVGAANALGTPVSMAEAEDRLFGVTLLNDWSARDIQAWEYQPLGPFLAKNFATTISPWVVTLEALAPYRAAAFARAPGDPQPMAYLDSADNRAMGGLDLNLEALILTAQMRAQGAPPVRLSRSNFKDSYWTMSQFVTHHTVGGCNLQPGDLFGSGTQSGPTREQYGSMLELSWGGKNPILLPNGEKRTFLEDGDTLLFKGSCERDGYARIGFGEAAGTVLPSRA